MSDEELKGSEARLWALVDERARAPAADRAVVDERIWDLFGETWAVMFTDLSGFSRHVEAFGILHFLQIIHEQKKLFAPIIAAHDGVLVKTEADSMLLLFRRADRALQCALAMQAASTRVNAGKAPEDQILLCVGLGYGRILRIGHDDVFGAEVNASSKLGEDLAKAGEILVTDAAMHACKGVAGVAFEAYEGEVPGSKTNWRARY